MVILVSEQLLGRKPKLAIGLKTRVYFVDSYNVHQPVVAETCPACVFRRHIALQLYPHT